MKPKDAKKVLAARIKDSGGKLAALTPVEGIRHMIDFYKEIRAHDCPLDEDGDMLLYQWGTYEDLDGGKSFHLDITRQFTLDDDDCSMSQLSLTFFFRPPTRYKKLKDGNRWCSTLKEIKAFKTFVENTSAYQMLAGSAADEVKLAFSRI
jgi:hypothetical protein